MLPSSATRVTEQTEGKINESIRKRTEDNIQFYSSCGREGIDRRLDELDREWDIERAIEANASALALAGIVLGTTVNRKWFILPTVVAGFLLQHSLQGWCPPVPVFRRLGFRTSQEIEYERYSLKAQRGDFGGVQTTA